MDARWLAEVRARAEQFWDATRRAHLLGTKQLLLDPVADAPLLRVMGLVQRDGSMSAFAVRKFMQVNQLVALLEPMLKDLMAREPCIRVLDAGCGRSYLTFLLAWCFEHRFRHPAEVLGLDRQAVLVDKCTRRAAILFDERRLRFVAAPVAGLDLTTLWSQIFGGGGATPAVHAVMALHACDTATDDALALGLRVQAPLLAVVPCCHAELAARWREADAAALPGTLRPIWNSPHLRREAGATFTDALRLLLLRQHGYRTTALECVPSEHTPKNTLLRAVRHDSPEERRVAAAEFVMLRNLCGGYALALERQMPCL